MRNKFNTYICKKRTMNLDSFENRHIGANENDVKKMLNDAIWPILQNLSIFCQIQPLKAEFKTLKIIINWLISLRSRIF